MTQYNWIKSRSFFIIFLSLFLFNQCVVSADISGSVEDPEGNPLEAKIRIYQENREIITTQTDSNGIFNVNATPGQYYLIVYSDDANTPGFDYVPAAYRIDGEFNNKVTLNHAFSLNLVGEFQYVDTENLPLKNSYIVQDASYNVISPNGFPLEFSDRNGGLYAIPERSSKEVILPVVSSVNVNVSSNILVGSQIVLRSFIIEEIPPGQKGEVVTIDVRKYTIPISQSITHDALEQLETRLTEMDNYGFYLAKQEAEKNSGIKYVGDSEIKYENGNFDESFGSLKRGYILFTHTYSDLVNMYRDARLSVYLLIGFLTISSIVTGYLLFDELIPQVLADIVLLVSGLVFFYYTYPGSRTIALNNFIVASAIMFISFFGLGIILPRFFNIGGADGRVHTRNLISPIFNIARRSLRRRKVRFLLTFISITLLVMSFVSLTSFSEGYGLITGESQPKTGWEGVFIREGNWKQEEPSFISSNEVELDWIRNQPETSLISIKAENTPNRSPIVQIQGQPIYGLVGISMNETFFINIELTLIAGELPGDEGVLISESLSDSIGSGLGDQINLDLRQYNIEGVFDDELFKNLNDLDGTPYSPNKWVNISPEGEPPNWMLDESEPNEIIISTTQEASKFPTVGVQRIAIKIDPNYNATGFAERLALERGYLAWSNNDEAYSSFRLGNYFQGKGATLLIPWIIVVLNVIVTMLNNLYERRNEIEILSSVGLNPAQVSSIFIAEATITGFIAGGLGYLIGLGFYKTLAILNIGLQVHQKVSAIWSIAAIGLAISAVVTGALTALKNSVVITPSLMRRWKLDPNSGGFQEPWRINIPIKLEPAEIQNYLDYVEAHLRRLMNHPTHMTSSIKREDDERLNFIYKSVQTSTGNFYTKNTLHIHRTDTGEYSALLESLGETEWVHLVGSHIRRITMDYSTEKRV